MTILYSNNEYLLIQSESDSIIGKVVRCKDRSLLIEIIEYIPNILYPSNSIKPIKKDKQDNIKLFIMDTTSKKISHITSKKQNIHLFKFKNTNIQSEYSAKYFKYGFKFDQVKSLSTILN